MIVGLIVVLLWVYSLYICHIKQLNFFKFILGSVGLFLLINTLFFEQFKFGIKITFDLFLSGYVWVMQFFHLQGIDVMKDIFRASYIDRYYYEEIEIIIVLCLSIFFPVHNIKRKILNVILSV